MRWRYSWNGYDLWLNSYTFDPEEDFEFLFSRGDKKYCPNLPYAVITKYKGDNPYSLRIPAVVNVTYPVRGISKWAFAGCRASHIIIPTTAEYIGRYAFANCKRLKDILLPRGIRRISQGAFAGCTRLSNVYFAGSYEEFKNLQIVTGKLETRITGPESGLEEMTETYLRHIPGNETLVNAMIHFGCEYTDSVIEP